MNDSKNQISTLESIQSFRKEYSLAELDQNKVAKNPFSQFLEWFADVQKAGFFEPNAMTLATVGLDNKPTQRVLLMKDFSENGILFFTNYESKKAFDLQNNNAASILFYWPELERQVRIEGSVSKTREEDSDKYFSLRPRGSQIAGAISPQSTVIQDRQILEGLFLEASKKYEGQDISRPKNWGGYCLKPIYFEFWQGRENRLHDRITYRLSNNTWLIERLAP
jgi:pyridoxamine 5'-phosphate oxidase